MFDNRLRSVLPARRVTDPTPSPAAFFLCPVVCLPVWSPARGQWQQSLYEWAFAQAKAVVLPSLPERDLLAVWN
jgi:hypothetical protein